MTFVSRPGSFLGVAEHSMILPSKLQFWGTTNYSKSPKLEGFRGQQAVDDFKNSFPIQQRRFLLISFLLLPGAWSEFILH